jgi:hypothetical protein
MAPAAGGISLNVGNLAAAGGANHAGGYGCIHSRNAANEMTMLTTTTNTPTPTVAPTNANHSDHRVFSPKMRLVHF